MHQRRLPPTIVGQRYHTAVGSWQSSSMCSADVFCRYQMPTYITTRGRHYCRDLHTSNPSTKRYLASRRLLNRVFFSSYACMLVSLAGRLGLGDVCAEEGVRRTGKDAEGDRARRPGRQSDRGLASKYVSAIRRSSVPDKNRTTIQVPFGYRSTITPSGLQARIKYYLNQEAGTIVRVWQERYQLLKRATVCLEAEEGEKKARRRVASQIINLLFLSRDLG